MIVFSVLLHFGMSTTVYNRRFNGSSSPPSPSGHHHQDR